MKASFGLAGLVPEVDRIWELASCLNVAVGIASPREGTVLFSGSSQDFEIEYLYGKYRTKMWFELLDGFREFEGFLSFLKIIVVYMVFWFLYIWEFFCIFLSMPRT